LFAFWAKASEAGTASMRANAIEKAEIIFFIAVFVFGNAMNRVVNTVPLPIISC
jgi:hypothetical protein